MRRKRVYWIGAQEDGKVKTTLSLRKTTYQALRDYAARKLARSRGGGLRVSEALDSLVRIAFECIIRHRPDIEEDEQDQVTWQEAKQEGLSISKRPDNRVYTLLRGRKVADPDDDDL